MVLFALANTGLPGTSGFVGEFLVVLASFKAGFWYAFLASMTLILSAAYMLWLLKNVVFGAVASTAVASLVDISAREMLIFVLVAAGVLWLGLWPAPLADVMSASVDHLAMQIMQSKIQAAL
jgi:NADH-quinone oxidoreductase subunit M